MRLFYLSFFICISFLVQGQSKQITSSEIFHKIEQFANTATLMYVAAHPDDENTRLISWLTNAKHVNTVYLSLTRGDGGQNLIGTEKGKLLGLLRTQELLEARKIDGGHQWFTRANDFGYSKTATETLKIWDEEKILSDVVWAIRKHRPSVIITRFNPDSNGDTHGHHTSSAILAMKAFDLAADSTAYPNQLKHVAPWQPKRLFYNTSWWAYGSREAFKKIDKSDFISIDVGQFLPMLGRSNNEIAALSRSKHACQGFGAELQRGSQTEWLRLLKGDLPTNGLLLQGVKNGFSEYEQIQQSIQNLKREFNFKNPSESLHALIDVAKLVKKQLPESAFKKQKIREVNELILLAGGIYMEWTTEKAYGVSGNSVTTSFEFTNRGGHEVSLLKSVFPKTDSVGTIGENKSHKKTEVFTLPVLDISTPYWLKAPMQGMGMYTVADKTMIGKPENKPAVQQSVQLSFKEFGYQISSVIPLQFKKIDPTKGEVYEPFYIVPPVAVNLPNSVYLFADNMAQTIPVKVTSFVDNAKGNVRLEAGMEWIFSQSQSYHIEQAGGTQTVYFQAIPPQKQSVDTLRAAVTYSGNTYFNSLSVVDYDHIDKQMVFMPAKAVIERINLKVADVKIAYVQGSGDDLPESLRQIGLRVDELKPEEITTDRLKKYDVVVLGIRAFNTVPELAYKQESLWAFAKQGGVVISQYNTTRGLVSENISPLPLKLSRNRISQENAELTILAPKHKAVTAPNKITQADFTNWIQERGLYFADEWDESFVPILEGNDTGENPKQGMLLVAKTGEGYYVYTGLSFFRELPAGVPGAYRLFANLLSLNVDE